MACDRTSNCHSRNEAMSVKESVIEAIEKLPAEATIEDIQEEIAILAGIQRAQSDIEAGHYVTNEVVKQRIAEWLTK
jgi:predicted transcriptional regulator